MTEVESKNGKYPIMQNPGVPRVFEVKPPPAKNVLLINGAVLANPNGYDEKVLLYPAGSFPPTEGQEEQVLAETTLTNGRG